MKGFALVCFVSAAVLISLVELGNAQEKTCKFIVSDLTKRQMGGIAACSKTMTFKNGKDKAAKMNCVLKCVMSKEGVVDKEGRMPAEVLDAFLKKEFPESLLATVGPMWKKCQEEAAAGLDPNPATDEFCKSYDPLIKCMLGVIGKMCPK